MQTLLSLNQQIFMFFGMLLAESISEFPTVNLSTKGDLYHYEINRVPIFINIESFSEF